MALHQWLHSQTTSYYQKLISVISRLWRIIWNHTISVLFGRLCQRNHVDVCEKAFLRHLCFSKYSLYRPYLLTISYSEIVEGKWVPLAPIVMLMALFDANSLLFLLILCLLYYFPEFFVELASTEIFCAQETRICLFGKDNCRLEATNFIFMENH